MSRDPYIDAKSEVETNIQKVADLLGSYNRLKSSDAATVAETVDDLETAIELLDLDLQDLDECVRVVEDHGDRWGIGDAEVRDRRAFVKRITRDVDALRQKVKGVLAATGRPERYREDIEAQQGGDEDLAEAERWEHEEQQLLMRRQDDTLGVISGTLTSLASQAGLIGTEVNEHSIMLDDLNTSVDTTESRLRKVSRSMQEFIRKNEDTKSSWCIAILILVLIVLLVLIILL